MPLRSLQIITSRPTSPRRDASAHRVGAYWRAASVRAHRARLATLGSRAPESLRARVLRELREHVPARPAVR